MAYHRTERSERVRAATRARILRAARRLFAKRGYAATTMRDIVEASGTSTGNLYFYFEDKADLLRTLLEGALIASWARGDEVLARTPAGPSKLAVMTYATTLGLLEHDRDLTRLIAGVETHAPVQIRLVELNTPRVREIIRECLPQLPPERLELTVAAWTGTSRYGIRLGASDERLAPRDVAAFIASWNLRAAGVPDAQIDEAIAYAGQAFTPPASPLPD